MPAAKLDTPIKQWCARKGIKFNWLARQMGLDRSYMAHIESGDRRPPPLYYERAAGLLGIPVDELRPPPVPKGEVA